jgi:hypothetical protein
MSFWSKKGLFWSKRSKIGHSKAPLTAHFFEMVYYYVWLNNQLKLHKYTILSAKALLEK